MRFDETYDLTLVPSQVDGGDHESYLIGLEIDRFRRVPDVPDVDVHHEDGFADLLNGSPVGLLELSA